MKKHITLLILGIALMTISSCRKEDETETKTVTEEETEEVIAKSLESSNSGLTEQFEDATKMANIIMQNPICALTYDSTINKTYSSATRSLDYQFIWGYQMNCNNNIPNNISFTYDANGDYSSVRMDANDVADGTLVLTQLATSQSSYLININYERTGNQTSKIGNQSSFTSDLTITGSNIEIDKTSYEILSGTASFSIAGSADNGNDFSFGGTITFLGGGSATINFNNGGQYTISI
ncbi:MAG: hypothetical protein H6598_01025 [Flavobacteriales bacterium]|nr:hypothetical protein [Flavobacteriales bacterium]